MGPRGIALRLEPPKETAIVPAPKVTARAWVTTAQARIKTPLFVCHGQNGNVLGQNHAALDSELGLK